MTITASIYDSSGNVLGDGPITNITNLSVRRVLDGVGNFSITVPLLDKRSSDLIESEREIRIYRNFNNIRREIFRGIVKNISKDLGGPGSIVKVSGPDNLDLLSKRVMGRFSSYENQPIATIIDSVLSKIEGWSASVETGLGNQSVKFGGSNLFKALTTMAAQRGVHVRSGLQPKQLEFGAFGQSSGITFSNNSTLDDELYSNKNVVEITKFSASKSSSAITTRIRPIGSGEGVAALTLASSDRTTPYTIQSTVDNGYTEYFIDSPNTALYGVIESYITFKEIVQITNSAASRKNAANQLYDAAIYWLKNNDTPIQQFKMSGIQPNVTIRPGDKVKVQFSGDIIDETDKSWKYVDINDEFWVMSVTENISGVTSTVDLEISNIDSMVKDSKQVLVDSLEAINVQNIQVKTTPFMYENTYTRFIEADDATNNPVPTPAKFVLRLSSQVVDVTSILLHIRTFPLYNFLSVYVPGVVTSDTPTPAAGVLHHHSLTNNSANGVWTLQEDTQYPTGLSIKINGIDYTSTLGGPWAPTNVQTDFDIDLTDVIKAQSGGFQRTHNIWFYPSQRSGNVAPPWSFAGTQLGLNASHGFLEANFNVQGVCQAIIPS